MRRFFNIFTIATLLFSLSSCEGNLGLEEDVNNAEDIIIPAGNFITFFADANTRASLLTENYITKPFGIFGYQYDFNKTWTGQRAQAIPNVFWNTVEGTKVPLKVEYDAGIYKYTADGAEGDALADGGQVNWNLSNRYAFWAYYPYENVDNTYFSVVNMTSEGAPYLIYKVNRTSTEWMYDVMTGGVSQVTAANSGNTVTFTMNHRLSAVDVSISNAYQHSYTDDSGTTNTEDVDIVITSLSLDFENLKYDSAKIFLEQNKNIPALNSVLTEHNTKTASYNLIGNRAEIKDGKPVTIGPTENEKTNITVEEGATMTFIPQEYNSEAPLTVTANITYHMIGESSGLISKEKLDANGDPVMDGYGNPILESEFTIEKETYFNQALVEGTRYYIVLSFTSEAVSINIITAEAWDDKEVDYEFM